MNSDTMFAAILIAAVVIVVAFCLACMFWPDKVEAFLRRASPEPVPAPPPEPLYWVFTIMSPNGVPRTLYIMGDHPLLWTEHERRRTRNKYDLLSMYEIDRELWDAVQEKSLVEIDDAPQGTRRRLRSPSL